MVPPVLNKTVIGSNNALYLKSPSDTALRSRQKLFEQKSLSNLLMGRDCNVLFKLIVSAMDSACQKEVKKDFRLSFDFGNKLFKGKTYSEKLEIINVALNCHIDEILELMVKDGSANTIASVSSVVTAETDSSFRFKANTYRS